ncbi:DUF4433 domain-containing protein [Rhodococcus sp. 077-4]|uniref:type II toxin-antitoxin system toxin DNA ADP-ribosyl transferase DarT n=1 Tax=Rhodococcus sp. 077-4 TaxID=2789271 RepID=UPI0039F5E248
MPGQRPRPTLITHFTHLDNMAAIVEHGLASDAVVQNNGRMTTEAGNLRIKSQRRDRTIDIPPGGCVADYIPFYFAPRSPMLYSLKMGNVPTFQGDTHDFVYIVTSTEDLVSLGLTLVVTDRNAALDYAEMNYEHQCDDLVDWDLMRVKMWRSTDEDPTRRERRMAECLVRETIPFSVIANLVVYGNSQRDKVEDMLESKGIGEDSCIVHVKPDWYF